MKPRTTYTINGNGRHFKKSKLELYRRDLCEELRRTGKSKLAEAYESKTLEWFAANGGYVIVK